MRGSAATWTTAREGNRLDHVIIAVAIAATVGTLGGCGYRLSPPSVAAVVFDTRLQHVSASDEDGTRERRGVRFVTLCRANFGTALENFSLSRHFAENSLNSRCSQLRCITVMIKYTRREKKRGKRYVFSGVNLSPGLSDS